MQWPRSSAFPPAMISRHRLRVLLENSGSQARPPWRQARADEKRDDAVDASLLPCVQAKSYTWNGTACQPESAPRPGRRARRATRVRETPAWFSGAESRLRRRVGGPIRRAGLDAAHESGPAGVDCGLDLLDLGRREVPESALGLQVGPHRIAGVIDRETPALAVLDLDQRVACDRTGLSRGGSGDVQTLVAPFGQGGWPAGTSPPRPAPEFRSRREPTRGFGGRDHGPRRASHTGDAGALRHHLGPGSSRGHAPSGEPNRHTDRHTEEGR